MRDVSDSFYAVSSVHVFEMRESIAGNIKKAKAVVRKSNKNAVIIRGTIGSKECLVIVILISNLFSLNFIV